DGGPAAGGAGPRGGEHAHLRRPAGLAPQAATLTAGERGRRSTQKNADRAIGEATPSIVFICVPLRVSAAQYSLKQPRSGFEHSSSVTRLPSGPSAVAVCVHQKSVRPPW